MAISSVVARFAIESGPSGVGKRAWTGRRRSATLPSPRRRNAWSAPPAPISAAASCAACGAQQHARGAGGPSSALAARARARAGDGCVRLLAQGLSKLSTARKSGTRFWTRQSIQWPTPELEGNRERMAKTAEKKKAKAKAGAKKPKASAARAASAPVEKAAPAPIDAAANAALASQAALAGTRAAGKAVTTAAGETKGPLAMAGGLAAGVAGGLLLVSRRRRRRRRAPSFDISGAAERIGALGEEVGRVANVIQHATDGSKNSR